MQALKNKLHIGSNKDSTDSSSSSGKKSLFGRHSKNAAPTQSFSQTTTTTSTGALPVQQTTTTITQSFDHGLSSNIPQAPLAPAVWNADRAAYYEDLEQLGTWNRGTGFSGMNNWNGSSWNSGSTYETTEFAAIPQAPPAPALWTADRVDHYDDLETLGSWTRGSWTGLSSSTYGSQSYATQNFSSSSNYSSTEQFSGVIYKENLPVQIIEKPLAIHEEIRQEQIEEIQPVINIEKIQTEIHQVTQPLFDKEIKPVLIEQRTLATEVLPEVMLPGRGFSQAADMSSVHVQNTQAVVIEKPALYTEVDKLQVIQEIQPVLYKETIVPTVIQETKPVYQKIVEGASYTQETLAPRVLIDEARLAEQAYQPDMTETAPVFESVSLPVQIIEKPVTIHEEIREELVEEIQPVISIEKLQTEVHQVTQPLFDKEIRPVMIEQRTLATEVLPEVMLPGRGMAVVSDVSSINYLDTKEVIIERPAIYNEVDRLQVIEEIQPVLYKETIVPTVVQETRPVYQKIVEGPVYVQTTLPAQSLTETHFRTLHTSNWNQHNISELRSTTYSASNLDSSLSFTSASISSPLTGRSASVSSPMLGQKTFVQEKTFQVPSTLIETTTQTTQTTTSGQSALPTYAL